MAWSLGCMDSTSISLGTSRGAATGESSVTCPVASSSPARASPGVPGLYAATRTRFYAWSSQEPRGLSTQAQCADEEVEAPRLNDQGPGACEWWGGI